MRGLRELLRARGEEGFAAVEYAVGVGMLLMAAVVTLSLATWVERQSLARLAAREAARAAAVEADLAAGAALGPEIAANHGVEPADLSVSVGGSTERGGVVVARATVRLPALSLPFLDDVAEVSWTATHAEAVDSYRSRVAG